MLNFVLQQYPQQEITSRGVVFLRCGVRAKVDVLRIRFESSLFMAMEVRQSVGSDSKAPEENDKTNLV